MEKKKLNIVFISSWYPNKIRPLNGIFVKRHAAANTIDCDVSAIFVCSAGTNSIEESVEDGIYTLRGYYKKPKLKAVQFIRYFLMWRKVWLFYKKKNGMPDLINANIVYPVSIIAVLIKYIYKIPYIITEHCTFYFPEDGRYRGFIIKLISRLGVANASAVITDSNKLSGAMQSLGLRNEYFVIPNVVDTNVFALKQPLKNECFNFLHISSLDEEQKNIIGIIRAFKKFHAIHPLSKLTIVWDEEQNELLERIKMKEPFSEEDGIFLHGKAMDKDLAAFMQNADAFVLFSNYENLPCVMLESFSCGVPVIGTKVGDVPLYINEKNGVLIDVKNETQLYEAMEKIYNNPAAFNPAEIRNRVIDKVSPPIISKQFTGIYKMALNLN